MSKFVIFRYIAIFLVFCVITYFFIDPNFIYLKFLYSGIAFQQRSVVVTFYFIILISMFMFYLSLLKASDSLKLKNILMFLVPLAIIGIFAYPAALSFDLFNYIATAKVTFHYFENPYVVMPIEFLGDPILLFTHAANKIALYGPLWILLTSIPFYLSFGNYLSAIVIFKAFVSLFYFGIVYLIWKMTKSTFALLYFAASPLVLIETFISGHNDVVMMFFALLSVFFLKKKIVWLAFIFLAASILIKYATLFLVPLFVYYFYCHVRHKEVNWDKFYLWAFLLMLVVFFLSPLREEIYPWYAIWPLTFLALVAQKKRIISYVFIFFTFCLMMRYVPFMLIGTYFGPTPNIKIVITFIVPGLFTVYLLVKNKFKFNKQ